MLYNIEIMIIYIILSISSLLGNMYIKFDTFMKIMTQSAFLFMVAV